jgi:hypothetical protein
MAAIDRLAMEDPRAKTDPAVLMEGLNEVFSWAPQTLRLELVRTTGVLVSWPAMERLMAAITIISTDDFFQNGKRFIRLCNVLSGDSLDPEVWDPADTEECAWGITEAYMLTQLPPDAYCDDVRYYVGSICREEGILQPPAVLAAVAKFDDKLDTGLSEFTDDPELYDIVNYVQQDRAAEIQSTVQARMQDLLEQIRELPLLHGSAEDMLRPFQQ